MKNDKRQVVKLTEEQIKMVFQTIISEQSEIDLNEKRAIYKPQWVKGDHILAWFNSKYGVESLGYSEEYIANNIIGTSVFSFRGSTSNFNVLDGRPGLDNYTKISKPRDKDAQMEVYREYKDVPYETLRKICLNFIEEVQNNSDEPNKFMLAKKIADKDERDKQERLDAIKRTGRDPNKLTFIGRRPKNEPSPEDFEDNDETNIEEPMKPQKTTQKDEVKNFLKQMYDKFASNNPELADDIQFISDYIDSELVDKETLSEIKKLFNKSVINENKKSKKIIRIKESDVKNIVKRILKEQEDLQEFGVTWVTRIKIDSPDNKTKSDEEKSKIAQQFGNQYNGLIAVEFNPGEWYNSWGDKVNIEDYENEVHGKFQKRGYGDPASHREHFRKARKMEDPNYEDRYSGFDDYVNRTRKLLYPSSDEDINENKKPKKVIKLKESDITKIVKNIIDGQKK